MFLMTLQGYFSSDYYITGNLAYDWFAPNAVKMYWMINFTNARVIENILLVLCSYVHR